MSDGSRNSAAIVCQIKESFHDVLYPGDGSLTAGYSSESFDISNWLKGRRWEDLSLEELVRNHESLFFMTPQAVQYYLPAFLLASVLSYREANPLPSTVLFFLTFPKNHEDRSRFRARFHLLTKSQGDAIRAFLEFMRDDHAEDYLQGDEVWEALSWWSASWEDDLDTNTSPIANNRSRALIVVGIVLTTVSILALGITLWFCGFNPSHWLVMMGESGEFSISGWTITVTLLFTLSVGLFLLGLYYKRKQRL